MERLKKGDTVLITAPAGMVTEDQIQPALNVIKANDWNYEIAQNTFNQYNFAYKYAGTPQERLNDLQWALDHPYAKAIWFARGGYGGVQIVDRLNLNKFKKNPKWLIGYSDNTVFHQHFNRRGFPSLHATVCKPLPQGQSQDTYSTLTQALKQQSLNYTISPDSFNQQGEAQGLLTGGNLSILYSLLGSNTLDHFKDKILFIEDWYENYYHIDRMLIGLERAGALKGITGLIVGGFTKMDSKEENSQYDEPFDSLAYEVISERFKNYHIPKVFGFPTGHIYDTRALIMGAGTKLIVTKDKVVITNNLKYINS